MTETTRLLRDLVRLPSVNPMGRALQSSDLYEEPREQLPGRVFPRTRDVTWERQTVAPQRSNIVARFTSPGARRTIIFEAHQDTVPTDNMTIDPFAGVVENGRLYGRGACDIKGGMAAMLSAFARLVREKPAGAANVVMACTVDEEHTFLGVQELVKRRGLKADFAVVAEPTCLQIVNAHKGVCRWSLSTSGRSCHSSAPEQGINAIYRMGRLLAAIETYAAELRPVRAAGSSARPAHARVSGRIEGGTSVNTVPDHCRIEIDRRLIPGDQPEAAPHQLTAFLKESSRIDFPFECSPLYINCPALGLEKSGELVALLGRCIDAQRGSHEVIAVPYGTDASTLAEAGIPSVVFGPGNIAQAHTRDEWVPLDEVEEAAEILYRLAVTSG